MAGMAGDVDSRPRAPWHLWLVGVLALLWNAAGAYTIVRAQVGRLPGISADEAAYYMAQARWFVILTDAALLSAILGALALLLRSRWAVPLFIVSLIFIAVTACYDLVAGTSRMFTSSGALIATLAIWALAVFQLWYSLRLRARGVLR